MFAETLQVPAEPISSMEEEDPFDSALPPDLPDISSLDHFARTQDPGWKSFLHGQGPHQASQLLKNWTTQLDDCPVGAALAALHMATSGSLPAPVLPAIMHMLSHCASLLEHHAKQPSFQQRFRAASEAVQGEEPTARSVLVIAFLASQCLLLQPHAQKQALQRQHAQQAQLVSLQTAAARALNSCCLLLHHLPLPRLNEFVEAWTAIGQVVQSVVMHTLLLSSKQGSSGPHLPRKQLAGIAALLCTHAGELQAGNKTMDIERVCGPGSFTVSKDQGSMLCDNLCWQFFSSLAKSCCAASTGSPAASTASFLSEVIQAAATQSASQCLGLVMSLAQVLVQQQATHLSQPQQAATTVLPSFTSVEADMALQATVLALVELRDPLASGLLLKTLLPSYRECPRAGVRKALLDCAASCLGGPTEVASYAAVAVSHGAVDRDATVRARALACFASTSHLLWHDATSHGQHNSIILTAVVPTLCSRLLDAVKSVRSKALLVLCDLLSYGHQHHEDMIIDSPGPDMGSAVDKSPQKVPDIVASTKQDVALASFPGICALLDARPDSQLHDEGCQQMAENALELIGRALGDRWMLQLILQLLQGSSCPSHIPRIPSEGNDAGALGLLNRSGQEQIHQQQQEQQQKQFDGSLPRMSGSPMLVAVLLARFVPSRVSIAYEAWGLHVEGVDSRDQLKSLAHTMEAAPSAMRHALYEEAFRSICTALGQQQQQQQQQQKGCTDLGLEVPPHGATVTLRRAAKLIFCLGRSCRPAGVTACNRQGSQSKQRHQDFQQQQQQQQARCNIMGEVAILADGIGFLLESLGHASQQQKNQQQQRQQRQQQQEQQQGQQGGCGVAPAVPTSLTSQLLHALSWCMCALQQVLVRQDSLASQTTGAGQTTGAAQHDRMPPTAPDQSTDPSVPDSMSAAAAAAAWQPSRLALKLVVRCLPELLQQCCACTCTPGQQIEQGSSAAAWQKVRGVTTEVGERTSYADGHATAADTHGMPLGWYTEGGAAGTGKEQAAAAAGSAVSKPPDDPDVHNDLEQERQAGGSEPAVPGAAMVAVPETPKGEAEMPVTAEAAMAAVDEALRLLCRCPGGSPYAQCLLHVLEARLGEASREGRPDAAAVPAPAEAGCISSDTECIASKSAGGQIEGDVVAQPARGTCLAGVVDAVKQLDSRSTMAVHLMLLGHMCCFYEAECEEFLTRARAAHQLQGQRACGAAAGEPDKETGAEAMESDDLPIEGKHKQRAGSGWSRGSGGSSSGSGYDNYMQQQEEERALQVLAQQYLDGLMQRTAPASRTPALLVVLGAPPGQFSPFLQVHALKSLSGLMLLSDTQALLHGHVLGSCLRKPVPFTQNASPDSTSVAASDTLCVAALDAVEMLMMRRPNASSQLLAHVEALVGDLLQHGPALQSPWLLVRAVVCLARIFASDKLQLSSSTWQVMANCALSSIAEVQEIAKRTLCALLLDAKAISSGKAGSTESAQARLIKGVLSLFGSCEAGRRRLLVDKVLLGWPLLREADLASDALVLPLLQSLAVADCKAARAAALALVAHACPSTKALASLHTQLQGLGIHLDTEEARSVLTALRAFVQRHTTKAAADRVSKAVQAGDISGGDKGSSAAPFEGKGLRAKLLGELDAMMDGMKLRRKGAGGLSTSTCAEMATEALGSLAAIKREEGKGVDVQQHQAALQSFKQQQQQQQQQQQEQQCTAATSSADLTKIQEPKDNMKSTSRGKGKVQSKQRAAVKRRLPNR